MPSNIRGVAGLADGFGASSTSYQNNNGSLQIARYYEVDADQADDVTLLHPPPAEPAFFEREKAYINAKCNGHVWKGGDTIRLLSELGQIKTDLSNGLDIDASHPEPPAPPKRLILLPQLQKILAGVILLEPDQGVSRRDLTQHGWAQESPIYISVFGEQRPCKKAYLADAEGQKIELLAGMKIVWHHGFTTHARRVTHAKHLYSQVKSHMQAADKHFEEAAKIYRISRRLWEIKVVEHEFFLLKKRRLFHPASINDFVKRAIKWAKKDIKREDEGNETLQRRGWKLVRGVDGRQIAQRKHR